VLPHDDIAVLRGVEGARMKEAYLQIARQFGIAWKGRRYDRNDPEHDDAPNQAINHAATAVEGAATIAVAATGTIPALGFIHEDSGVAWNLDIADLYRTEVTIPVAFAAVRAHEKDSGPGLERQVRRLAAKAFRDKDLIASMIDRIKEALSVNRDLT